MYNQGQLVARLVRKPELKIFNDNKLASFTLAQNKKVKGEQETNYFDCKAWNKVADKCTTLDKGDLVIIQYALDQEKWTNKEGKPVSKFILRVNAIMVIPKTQNFTAQPDEAIYPEVVDLGDPIF